MIATINLLRRPSCGCPILLAALTILAPLSAAHEVRDLQYGAVLYEYYQGHYFDALVEYAYAESNGGIQNHGDYPELLKGGVSLSYGMSNQAGDIFSRLLADNTTEDVQDRAWFYHGKMHFMKGDHETAFDSFRQVEVELEESLAGEYGHLAVLNAMALGRYEVAVGYADAAQTDSTFGPYITFNKGLAQRQYLNPLVALDTLEDAAHQAAKEIRNRDLANRSKMAIAFIAAENRDYQRANQYLAEVDYQGVYSSQALLSYGWLAVNQGQLQEAIGPLRTLDQRSIAIPEVQEAILLMPHIYEKMGLPGRASSGFTYASVRYMEGLGEIEKARETLKTEKILELFVNNMDDIIVDSDWFGIAPDIALNSLSPFLLGLISQHEFQALLRDLRDLYAIRNNLVQWGDRQGEFDVMLDARQHRLEPAVQLDAVEERLAAAISDYELVVSRMQLLDRQDRKHLQWYLDDIRRTLDDALHAAGQLGNAPIPVETKVFGERLGQIRYRLEQELAATDQLITKLQEVMIDLVKAEMEQHESRMKYYLVQARLARARLFDKKLMEIDPLEGRGEPDVDMSARGQAMGENKQDEAQMAGSGSDETSA